MLIAWFGNLFTFPLLVNAKVAAQMRHGRANNFRDKIGSKKQDSYNPKQHNLEDLTECRYEVSYVSDAHPRSHSTTRSLEPR